MFKSKLDYVIYDMREIYHELTDYTFKVTLNPKDFSDSKKSNVSMFDSDGEELKLGVIKWGRKMFCTFEITEDVSDGVATIIIDLCDDNDKKSNYRHSVWIIKP